MPFDINEYQLTRYATMHARIIEYLGGTCVHCGSAEDLEIDHVDRATKSFNISARTCLSWERLFPEVQKCQALCHDCHKVKSDIEKRGEHGEGKTGRRGCFCNLCGPLKRAAGREYTRRSREKKRTATHGRIGAVL